MKFHPGIWNLAIICVCSGNSNCGAPRYVELITVNCLQTVGYSHVGASFGRLRQCGPV
jgi:hypothetical protein